jgi:hypothetical protein
MDFKGILKACTVNTQLISVEGENLMTLGLAGPRGRIEEPCQSKMGDQTSDDYGPQSFAAKYNCGHKTTQRIQLAT